MNAIWQTTVITKNMLVILELVAAGAFDFSIFMINFSREYFAFFPRVYFTESS